MEKSKIENKIYKFFEFFIPTGILVGGFILMVNGVEIISELEGVGKLVVAVAVFIMVLGIIGASFKYTGLWEEDTK